MSGRDDSLAENVGASAWQVLEQLAYEPEGGPELTTVVIEAVAAAEGVEMTSITEPPLYDVVDIAAVEAALFGTRHTGDRDASTQSLNFEYRGFRITVRGDGWVEVAESLDR